MGGGAPPNIAAAMAAAARLSWPCMALGGGGKGRRGGGIPAVERIAHNTHKQRIIVVH